MHLVFKVKRDILLIVYYLQMIRRVFYDNKNSQFDYFEFYLTDMISLVSQGFFVKES